MKNSIYTYITLCLALTLLLACARKPACIQYPENDTKTCTKTIDMLGGKVWTFDSAIINGKNVTDEYFKKFDKYEFSVGKGEKGIGVSNYRLYWAGISMNGSNFTAEYASSDNRQNLDSLCSLHGADLTFPKDSFLKLKLLGQLEFGSSGKNGESFTYLKLTPSSFKVRLILNDSIYTQYYSVH